MAMLRPVSSFKLPTSKTVMSFSEELPGFLQNIACLEHYLTTSNSTCQALRHRVAHERQEEQHDVLKALTLALLLVTPFGVDLDTGIKAASTPQAMRNSLVKSSSMSVLLNQADIQTVPSNIMQDESHSFRSTCTLY